MTELPPSSSPGSPTPDELRKALAAFKKRLKLTRRDDEAGLGYGPMSSGRASGVVAIMPPNQFSKAVWDKLVEQGRLEYSGHGLYQLVKT